MNDQQRIIKLEADVEKLTKFVEKLMLFHVPKTDYSCIYHHPDDCHCCVTESYPEQVLDGDCMECGKTAQLPEFDEHEYLYFCQCGAAMAQVEMQGVIERKFKTCINKSCVKLTKS